MADVHDVYVDKRRSRVGPIIGLTLVILLLIALIVAMIMNIHGSISWPAGELKFGFWPQTAVTAATQVASDDVTVAIPPTSETDVQPVDEDVQSGETPPPATTPPAETEPAPVQ